jgi:hypothetical protein
VEPQPTILSDKQNASDTCILPLSYLPPIEFYQIMLKHKSIILDINENFHKQFYYNRCVIYGANGALKLSVPIVKNHKKTPVKDIAIFYDQNWKTIHWRSIQAAYRRSPFFEFYEDEFQSLYVDSKPERLIEWNLKLFELVNKLMGIEMNISFTESYQKVYENATDYRSINLPNKKLVMPLKEIQYQQVFQEKCGFIKNLSIVDLLFCEGHHSKQLLLP